MPPGAPPRGAAFMGELLQEQRSWQAPSPLSTPQHKCSPTYWNLCSTSTHNLTCLHQAPPPHPHPGPDPTLHISGSGLPRCMCLSPRATGPLPRSPVQTSPTLHLPTCALCGALVPAVAAGPVEIGCPDHSCSVDLTMPALVPAAVAALISSTDWCTSC